MVCYKVALKVIQTKLVTDDDLDLILKKNDEDDDKVTAKKDHPEHLTSTMDPWEEYKKTSWIILATSHNNEVVTATYFLVKI